MAADSLIDRYLAAFGAQVAFRHDRADLVDEVADHLLCAVERLHDRGLDRDTAERRALTALGQPHLVASLMMTNPSKGSTMPYFLSRHIWLFSAVAAVAWIVAGVSSVWGFTDLFGWTQGEYILSAGLLALACFATTAVLIGANLRLVGRVDATTGWITALAAGAGVLCAVGLAWMVGVWAPLLSVAVAWTLQRVVRTNPGARAPRRAVKNAVTVVGVAAFAVTLVSLVGQFDADWTILGLVGLLTATLIAAVVELAVPATGAGTRRGTTLA